MSEWTIETVKQELPDIMVKVIVDGKGTLVPGAVRGRKLPFPGVIFEFGGVQITAEYAWATVRDCLNGNRPLRYSLEAKR